MFKLTKLVVKLLPALAAEIKESATEFTGVVKKTYQDTISDLEKQLAEAEAKEAAEQEKANAMWLELLDK